MLAYACRVMNAATRLTQAPTHLDPGTWSALEAAHQERVDRATADHRSRRGQGVPHPIEDFLFSYYSTKPSQLRRWHPGVGVRLEGAAHAGASVVEALPRGR